MVAPSIDCEEVNKILKEGLPSVEQMERFPFKDLLKKLYYSNSNESKEYLEHGKKVLEAMNTLLGDTPGNLVAGIDDDTRQRLNETKNTIARLFSGFGKNAQALFRLAALYHDIGKYIIKDRHPTVGWYSLEYLDPNEKKALRSLLGNRENYLQLLMIMVRDHDEFGVLSTGEASYPILLRPASSLGNDAHERSQIISAIMWLNLADIKGTPGLVLNSADLDKVMDDWTWFLEAINKSAKNDFDNYVIREASNEELVVRRITRLLMESSRDIPGRIKEFSQPRDPDADDTAHHVTPELIEKGKIVDQLGKQIITQWVKNQLVTVYPTTIPRRDFCIQFTHICKLDYGKRFFKALAEYCEGPAAPEHHKWPKMAERCVSSEDLIYSVMAILRRMASTYSSMALVEGGIGNLIGVEMKDLTPNNAREKTAQIIHLLRESHYPGLSWMMSDCLAWYF